MIAVGATTMYGDYAKFSQHSLWPSIIWAPGVDIQCAGTSAVVKGMSFAAAIVIFLVLRQPTESELTCMSRLPASWQTLHLGTVIKPRR